jgi:glycine/D-amino acid oxidase-like deaminating enzyme
MSARGAPRVAVLGAGIMGSSTALFLARAGCEVVLIDQASSPMASASRWNEGKIHLGFLYAADSSTNSAKRMIPGGLAFKALIEELIGTSLAPAIAPEDDIYLVHPESVVDADSMERYLLQVRDLIDGVEGNSGYLASITPVERLSTKAAEVLSSGAIKAGFRVPERSVCTNWVADRLVEALACEPRIRLLMTTKVAAVNSAAGSWNGPWTIRSDSNVDGCFDAVVNALWEGRLAVDLLSGLPPEPGWSHRFRLSLFVRTARPLRLPSVVLATGPFGDIKSYNGQDFYLSWYPAGLVAEGTEVEPPPIRSRPSPTAFIAAVKQGLSTVLPHATSIIDNADEIAIGGGWVFARGTGSLADAMASLHRRDQFGIKRAGTYISVDTGKYSTAPWLARKIAAGLVETAGSRK